MYDTETIVDLWRSYQRAARGADPKLRRSFEMKAEGYTNDEIAAELARTRRMVTNYVALMRERLQGQR